MKKGITVSILVVTVVLMFVLVTTATVVGTRTIQTAAYEEFSSKVERVSNDVNKYVIDNNELPTTLEIIAKEGLPSALIAELNKNNDSTNNLFVIDMTKLRTESVNIGKGTVEDMDVFVVAENTNNVYYLKGVEYRGTTYYGIQTESINIENDVPEKWAGNVKAIVDGVPIPKGFVASQAIGENTKVGGLVIYEGTEAVTDVNVESARRNRNQYVWIPIKSEEFNTKFKRNNFGLKQTISNTLGTEYWEVELDSSNMPKTTQDLNYITNTTLSEVLDMYASVKEYEGFYIARYEAGIDNQRTLNTVGTLETNVYSTMGKIPYTYIPWTKNNKMNEDTGGAVQVARSFYPSNNTNYGVVSTLTYSVQWDAILQWWLDTKAVESVTESNSYGNYISHQIAYDDLNSGAKYTVYANSVPESYHEVSSTTVKDSETAWLLTTGALKAAKVNNIYDMAGNIFEYTMEGNSTNNRPWRGGYANNTGGARPVAQSYSGSYTNYYSSTLGFRVALYIKK